MLFKSISEKINAYPHLEIVGLKGGSIAYGLSEFRKTHRSAWVIIVPSDVEAERLYGDLLFFDPSLKEEVLIFPAWESDPFGSISPNLETQAERLVVLRKLLERSTLCVITTPEALLQKVLPKEVLLDRLFYLRKGESLDRGKLISDLTILGFSQVTTVEDLGTFAIRGGIVDIFPPQTRFPFRIEFLGDTIERIRTFDPATQLTSETTLNECEILPVREVLFLPDRLQTTESRIKQVADECGIAKVKRDELLEAIEHQIYVSGIEYDAPFFYEAMESLFHYLPESFVTVYLDRSQIEKNAEDFRVASTEAHQRAIQHQRTVPVYSDLYLDRKQLESYLNPQKFIDISFLNLSSERTPVVQCSVEDHRLFQPLLKQKKVASVEVLKPLAVKFKEWLDLGYEIYFSAHTELQLKRFEELLGAYGLQFLRPSFPPFSSRGSFKIHLVLGVLSQGFVLNDEKRVFITETEIFGERRKKSDIEVSKKAPFVTSLSQLQEGDPVVHVEHGVGRYLGLKHLELDGYESDFVLLVYEGQDRLYVPVHRINQLQRYVGAQQEKVRLDRLGGLTWTNTKKKVKKAIEEIAHELLEIYAVRNAERGYAFHPPDAYFHEMEATFEFEETPDQLKAIEDVLSDMCSAKPMDRLVCGDVGYGKTEVAIRAAFKAVIDRKQVALLAPTTLLVDQHLRVFQHRLQKFPAMVEMLSRFRTKKEQAHIVDQLKKGKIDIILGTHRLLSSDVGFHDLGLLIIDEEQRFGVRHKEKIKKLKKTVDVLTLSATPIPRTLHMAFLGIRDISLINTPPQDRLSIRTVMAHFNEETIQQAILKEIKRGGQVFFVHNKVQTIVKMTERLERMVPQAKFRFAHGQMNEGHIEKTMIDFLENKFQVLVCTTIIGSGIDIPTANTILIDRADQFGLAELYQLRGRVGRSRERAYAYLLIPPERELTDDAKKRLHIIQGAEALGSGFQVASYDLEIRGGGNILGKDQSGQIEAVGFEMYTQLLEESVRSLKGEMPEETLEPEIHIRVNAYIPQDYMADMSDKLTFYRKLSSIQQEDELDEIEIELKDRFGPLPKEVFNLFEIMTIKFYLKKMHIRELNFGNQRGIFTFMSEDKIPVDDLLPLIQKHPKIYQLRSDGKLIVQFEHWQQVLPFVRTLWTRRVSA